jgi:hypothetical protein
MKITELLEAQRRHYIQALKKFWSARGIGYTEAMLSLDNNAPEPVYRILRGDFVRLDESPRGFELEELKSDALHTFPTETYELLPDCWVEVHPFSWGRCRIEILVSSFDRTAYLAWASHWLDDENEREANAEGLLEVLHYVSPPSYPMGKLNLFLDLGTVPARALMELLKLILAGQKSAKVVITSFGPGEMEA